MAFLPENPFLLQAVSIVYEEYINPESSVFIATKITNHCSYLFNCSGWIELPGYKP